jgi:hypothetical protein
LSEGPLPFFETGSIVAASCRERRRGSEDKEGTHERDQPGKRHQDFPIVFDALGEKRGPELPTLIVS